MSDPATFHPESFLLTSIARLHLGDPAATIISSLIYHGRLTSGEISNRCKLPIKTVKSTLVSLIQLHCLHYWKTGKVVHYSLNESGLWVFLHSGDIIDHIHSIYDEECAQIIQNIIQVGHVRIQDYIGSSDDKNQESSKPKQLQWEENQRFLKLFSDGWLKRVQPFDFHSIQDLWNKLYQETLKTIPRSVTTSEIKRVAEAKEKTKIKLSELLESGLEPNQLYDTEGGIRKLKPSLVVMVNLERFEKHLRTRSLVAFANSRIGPISAKVYEQALLKIEQKSPPLKHYLSKISGIVNDPEEERLLYYSLENKLVDQKLTTFNSRDIERTLTKVNLNGSIISGKRVHNNLGRSNLQTSKRIKLEEGFLSIPEESNQVDDVQKQQQKHNEEEEEEEEDGDMGSIFIVDHLKLLASSTSVSFLIETSPGIYTVPFIQLTKELKQYTFDSMIKHCLGLDSFKILRTLRSLKLADEKTIANTVLLKEKTVRTEIFKLVSIAAVEVQEIPRSADRAASKTFFVFRHKPFVSYQFMAKAILYNMAEVLQNIENFKLDNKILLDKCEREDVKNNEEQLLLESELKTLRELQRREIKNIGKFNRLKTMHNIFGLFK